MLAHRIFLRCSTKSLRRRRNERKESQRPMCHWNKRRRMKSWRWDLRLFSRLVGASLSLWFAFRMSPLFRAFSKRSAERKSVDFPRLSSHRPRVPIHITTTVLSPTSRAHSRGTLTRWTGQWTCKLVLLFKSTEVKRNTTHRSITLASSSAMSIKFLDVYGSLCNS